MKERIAVIIEKEGLTPTQFADQVGIQRSTLSHILNGRNNASIDIITKIHAKKPDISLNWLLFGEGDMFSKKSSYYQPSIFDEIIMNRATDDNEDKYRKEIAPNTDKKEDKIQENKEVTSVKTEEIRYKKITKIMVFYSDNTFDTFSSDMYK